ncbi:MAG TPA: polysaccharide deacetylase family protein [Planctomycetota bacterium]|nr:polysaccharide deacetylase family protein [Planctomycetota bacterium]
MLRAWTVASPLLVAAVLACTLPSAGAVQTAVVISLAASAALVAASVTSARTQWLVPTVFEGPPEGNRLALTFDDGPDAVFTPQVLDLLRAHGAHATFFMVGARVEAHPELARRVCDEGHQIGSHSFHHGSGFHFLSPRRMADEIQRGIDSIERVTGMQPTAFRPPMGLRVPGLRKALARLRTRVTCVTWTRRALDTTGRPAQSLVARLDPYLVPGAILCLHDGRGFGGSMDRSATIEALGVLLPRITTLGLRCVRLDELGASCGPARRQWGESPPTEKLAL